MGIEFKDIKSYKTIIFSMINASGMPYDHALSLLLDEIDTYQIEDFIELIVDKISNKEDK